MRLWLKRIVVGLVAVYALAFLGWAPYWLGGLATTRRFQNADKENAGLTPASPFIPSHPGVGNLDC